MAGVTIRQAIARMNSAHVSLLLFFLERPAAGALDICDSNTRISDARGWATAFATLRRWGAVEETGETRPRKLSYGMAQEPLYRLGEFGRALIEGSSVSCRRSA